MDLLEHSDFVHRYLFGTGIEIGAFKTPIPGIRPIYLDRFGHYAGEPSGAEYLGDACDLPIEDSCLDYVASSHLLEHVANPIAAIKEWSRVLKDNGIIYMVVPHRLQTFDFNRPLTTVSHMVEDYVNGTTQIDGTHIDDFVFGVDWNLFSPQTSPNEEHIARNQQAHAYRAAIASGNEINIHFHTFEPIQLVGLIRTAVELRITPGIQILHVENRFSRKRPDGFLVIARVLKPGHPVSKKNIWTGFRKRPKNIMKSSALRF